VLASTLSTEPVAGSGLSPALNADHPYSIRQRTTNGVGLQLLDVDHDPERFEIKRKPRTVHRRARLFREAGRMMARQ
jgi:hypothetical protein